MDEAASDTYSYTAVWKSIPIFIPDGKNSERHLRTRNFLGVNPLPGGGGGGLSNEHIGKKGFNELKWNHDNNHYNLVSQTFANLEK